jgi:hypothetical protein
VCSARSSCGDFLPALASPSVFASASTAAGRGDHQELFVPALTTVGLCTVCADTLTRSNLIESQCSGQIVDLERFVLMPLDRARTGSIFTTNIRTNVTAVAMGESAPSLSAEPWFYLVRQGKLRTGDQCSRSTMTAWYAGRSPAMWSPNR